MTSYQPKIEVLDDDGDTDEATPPPVSEGWTHIAIEDESQSKNASNSRTEQSREKVCNTSTEEETMADPVADEASVNEPLTEDQESHPMDAKSARILMELQEISKSAPYRTGTIEGGQEAGDEQTKAKEEIIEERLMEITNVNRSTTKNDATLTDLDNELEGLD